MTDKELLYDISRIVESHFGIDSDEVQFKSSLMNDLGLDSLDKIELIMEIEKYFDIGVTDAEMEKAFSGGRIQNIIDLVSTKV